MVSDQDIARGVETLLRQSHPNNLTSVDALIQQLEAKLGLNLSHKAGFIRDQINHLLRSHPTTVTTAAAAASVISRQSPSSLPQQQPQLHPRALHLSQIDHFALQHHSQFQQFPAHFALHPHGYHPQPYLHQVLSQELSFHQPPSLQTPRPPQQRTSLPQQQQQQRQQPPPAASSEAVSKNATSVPSELPKESARVGAKRRGGPGGLNKVCGVSPELQAIVGEPALPRTEIVKQLWAYIRKNNLQDPSNKRKINCDDALRVVFETDFTDMFQMNKLLAKHIISLEPTKESAPTKRMKVDLEATTEKLPSNKNKMISEALAKFLGTGRKEMTQLEASNRVWEYIKVNKLEDPLNAMVIQCDAKLRELLGCENISAVGVEEMLARHHLFQQS